MPDLAHKMLCYIQLACKTEMEDLRKGQFYEIRHLLAKLWSLW
jgi:hypothetical protein